MQQEEIRGELGILIDLDYVADADVGPGDRVGLTSLVNHMRYFSIQLLVRFVPLQILQILE